MECSQARHILFSEAEEDLTEELRGQLLEHLAKCRSCSHQFEALSEQSRLLRSLPRYEAPPGFLDSVRRQVEVPRRSFPDYVRDCLSAFTGSRPFLRFAATAAAAIIVVTSAHHVLKESSVRQGVLLAPTTPAPVSHEPPSPASVDTRTPDVRTGPAESNSHKISQPAEGTLPSSSADRSPEQVPGFARGGGQPGVLSSIGVDTERPTVETESSSPPTETSRFKGITPQRQLLREKASSSPKAETAARMQAAAPAEPSPKPAPSESKSLDHSGRSAATGMAFPSAVPAAPSSKPARAESNSIDRAGRSAATAMPAPSAAPAARKGLTDDAIANRTTAKRSSSAKQPMTAPPAPLTASQPGTASGARTHEVSIVLTLDPPDSFPRGELERRALPQQTMKDSSTLSFSGTAPQAPGTSSPGQTAPAPGLAEPSKSSPGPDLRRQRLSSIRSMVLRSEGTIVSEKSDLGSAAPSELILDIPSRNYPAFLSRLQALGKTEIKSGGPASLPGDTMVRVTVTVSDSPFGK